MRRIIMMLLVLCMMIVCTGCNKTYLYIVENDGNMNYNNISAKNSNFWLTEEACYYADAPIYELKYFAISGDCKQKLFSAHNAAFARIQAHDNMLYTLDWVDDTLYRFCSYNTDTEERSELGYKTNVRSYFVLGEYIYYIQEYDTNGARVQPFCSYSLTDGTEKEIASSIVDAGVMNNTPVYLTQENDEFQLYAYDSVNGTSELRGSFLCPIASDEGVEDFVNFTSDQVILTLASDDGARVICYDIGDGQISESHVDGWVTSLIAYDDYAFMTIVEDSAEETDNWESSIYRLQLHNGEMEMIAELKGSLDTFVTSDQCVYVVQSTESNTIYRYDNTGERTLVGKY